MEPDNPLLDDFILSLCRRRPARVCFIPTASADSATYITKFYRAFSGRCIPTDLTLYDSPALPRQPAQTRDLDAFVQAQDVFYVGGGNTAKPWPCGARTASTGCCAVRGGRARYSVASVPACCVGSKEGSQTHSEAIAVSTMAWVCFAARPVLTSMGSRNVRPLSDDLLLKAPLLAMQRRTVPLCTSRARGYTRW